MIDSTTVKTIAALKSMGLLSQQAAASAPQGVVIDTYFIGIVTIVLAIFQYVMQRKQNEARNSESQQNKFKEIARAVAKEENASIIVSVQRIEDKADVARDTSLKALSKADYVDESSREKSERIAATEISFKLIVDTMYEMKNDFKEIQKEFKERLTRIETRLNKEEMQ